MTLLEPARVLHEVPGRRHRSNRVAVTLAAVLLASTGGAAALHGLRPPQTGHPSRGTAAPGPSTNPPGGAGYRQSREGAMAAALDDLAVYGSPAMYDASRRAALIAGMTSPSVEATLQRQVDAAFTQAGNVLGLDSSGRSAAGTLVARSVPVGTRAVSYDGSRAVVAVWQSGLLGVAGPASRNPVQESWSTETVTLDWVEGTWKWATLQHAEGPVPIGSAQVPASAEAIADAARRFGEVQHAS